MTDEMRAREEAICKVAGIKDIGDLSDGFHTFNQLYYQRMILFATIVKQNRDKAWKSLRHESGELCFGGGWFIVGIDTPEGSYTYHYEDNYYSLFDCVELKCGKHWDGHTEKDVTRLLSLPTLEKQEKCEGTVESHSEKNILDMCVSLLDEMVGYFGEYMEWLGYEPNEEERACGYFGMTYFHIVQKLFLYHTRHSGGSSTFQKCYELGIDDPSEGVRFPLWKAEDEHDKP